MMIHEGSTTACRLTKVVLALPHDQLVINDKSFAYEPQTNHLLFMPDMALWFKEYNLYRASSAIDVWKGSPYDFYTECRIQNRRGYGSIGGWNKETTHVNFYFLDKQMAMLFKLTWGGQ